MLHLLDDSLDAFLRATGPLPPTDVDVSFDPPDADWSAGLSRPAVNLYLWRLRRSVGEASAGTELVEQDGVRFRRGPRPRVELGYLITTWAAEARNAHQLLGRVLMAFLRTNELPAEFLQGALAQVRPPPSLSLSKSDDDPPSEFWTALGGRFQPGVELTVTATIDPEVLVEAAPEPSVVEVTVSDLRAPATSSRRRRVVGRVEEVDAGTSVRSPRGAAVVDTAGGFLVMAEPGDEVVVDSAPARRGVVPPAGPVTPTTG
ncbi:MAG: hypothetical protein QOI56_1073 [Actinomycetota bacterium]|jgi:hypothetical protein|nr:hypothetical protein [Actinomycetota bacterium]